MNEIGSKPFVVIRQGEDRQFDITDHCETIQEALAKCPDSGNGPIYFPARLPDPDEEVHPRFDVFVALPSGEIRFQKYEDAIKIQEAQILLPVGCWDKLNAGIPTRRGGVCIG